MATSTPSKPLDPPQEKESTIPSASSKPLDLSQEEELTNAMFKDIIDRVVMEEEGLTDAMFKDIIDRVFMDYYTEHQADMLLIPSLKDFEWEAQCWSTKEENEHWDVSA